MPKTDFFRAASGRGRPKRIQFHLLLDEQTRERLIELTREFEMSAAEVVRKLILEHEA